jgi:hypothetical protein
MPAVGAPIKRRASWLAPRLRVVLTRRRLMPLEGHSAAHPECRAFIQATCLPPRERRDERDKTMAQLSAEELKRQLAVFSRKAQEQGHVLGQWHYGQGQVTIPGMGGSSLQTVLTAGCEKCRADVSITLMPNHTLGEPYGLALTYPCPN